jgi:hypothetical protein
MKKIIVILFCLFLIADLSIGKNPAPAKANPNFFPIGVWVQSGRNAMKYKDIGVNMVVGASINQSELELFKQAGIRVIGRQNQYGLAHLDDPTIYGWMHGDEPDNAQSKRNGEKGYDPCRDPKIIIDSYNDIKKKDPSRPVYINLGQGVAYINYNGRGEFRGDTNKYKVATNGYLVGCDIASFDIYPCNNTDKETKENLWYVAKGIENLKSWSQGKPAWCWIETTFINAKNNRKPTTGEVKSEVWMALIHGASGVGYFCHTWVPTPVEAGFLQDPEMTAAIKAIDEGITALAPVLNSPTKGGYAKVNSSNTAVPIDIMAKNYKKSNYIFAVAMRPGDTKATFEVKSGKTAEVIGENRTIKITKGKFSDDFKYYAVHQYKIK